MQLGQIKPTTQQTGKKCPLCKEVVKVGEMAYYSNMTGSNYRYRASAKVWHRDCLAFFVNESQGLVQECQDIAALAQKLHDEARHDMAEGVEMALGRLLAVIGEKKALTQRETQAQRVEREFKELQEKLAKQHAPKKAPKIPLKPKP